MDVFDGIDEICVLSQDDDFFNIDFNIHQCVIFEHITYENNLRFDDILTLENENEKYELRTIMTVSHVSDVKYNACIYSRHGGCYKRWWLEKKIGTNKSYPVQIDTEPHIDENTSITVVYVRCQTTNLEDISKKLLHYIGGQTHIICHNHKLPLIPVPDRKAKCSCDNLEHFRCPDLDCMVCICNKCAATLDKETINIITHSGDGTEITNDGSDQDDHSCDDSMDSLLTPVPISFENDDSFSDSDSDEDSFDSNVEKKITIKTRNETDPLSREDFDNFVTSAVPDPFGYESDDSSNANQSDDGDFFVPTSDAGNIPFEVEKKDDLLQTRGMNVSGHVILNFVGTLLTRKRHQLKSSSIHKYFLQRLVSTTIGDSVSLLYPEGMLFPSIFWKMKEGSIIGAIPATLLTENIKLFGFTTIPQHIRSRLSSPSYQTSTNSNYISWSYDTLVNLATNKHDSRMVVNKGLTASKDESSGLSLRGGNESSALLDSIDSKQMIKNLMASQKYFPFDFFLSYTCNQRLHFGTKPIKEWIDNDEWKTNFPHYDSLSADERQEIKNSLDQASAGLLLRAWNESCRVFLDYLKNSPSSPFKSVSSLFARHEFQSQAGNLPHIHAMVKVNWEELSCDQKEFVRDCIRASVLDIVRVDEIPRLIEEGLLTHSSDVKMITNLGSQILKHLCNPRCLVMVGDDTFVCRKPNYLKKNPPPGNTTEKFEVLPNDLSLESLRRLEMVGIIEPLEYDEEMDYLKPFKSRLAYFHPVRHNPAVNWTHDLNISPVEGYTFAYCQSMQNIQFISNCGGCNKYTIKYVGKIDEQNYVIVYSDGHKNGHLVLKSTFLHNTKLSASKQNEEKARENKRENSHASGRAISLTEMYHTMMKYSEVATDLTFIDISTSPLEFRQSHQLSSLNKDSIEDGAEIGNLCNNTRIQLNLPDWRRFTPNQLIILQENRNVTYIDKITKFSVRPPELCSCFDQVGNYYRWFEVDSKSQSEEKLLELFSNDVSLSSWVDGECRIVRVRKKAIPEVLSWLNNVVKHDDDFNEDSGKTIMFELFHFIDRVIYGNVDSNGSTDEVGVGHLVYDDGSEEHLSIPVYSYIRPDMGCQFLLHILLSLGRFTTEIDLIQHESFRESFRYAKLIGNEDDDQSLQQYSNDVFVRFIEEQLIYFPNSRSIIDSWIIIAAELFDDAIKHNSIPITEMPCVQLTTLLKSNDEKCMNYIANLKKEVLSSALTELGEAIGRCSIPPLDDFLKASKQEPLAWDGYESFQKSLFQPEQSYHEQKQAIKMCIDAIDSYCSITQNNMVKSCTIRGFAGCGKSWCMQYCLLYCYAKGLIGVPTSVMSRRSVFLGSKHIDHLFCLPFVKKNVSPYQMAENAYAKLRRYPEKMNLLRVIDVLLVDEIGQLPAEILSAIEIILRRVRDHSNVFMGGVIIISTMDHTQLKPVEGRPFLLSTHVITCFKMFKLETSVRAVGDTPFQRLQKVLSMHYIKFTDKPELLDELRGLLHTVPTYVDNWSSPVITSDTYRLYSRRSPANEATQSFLSSVRANISNESLREKVAVDTQRLRLSHSEWTPASEETSKKLDRKVKESYILLFYKGAIYEFTHNKDGVYSQAQMCILFDLPDQDTLDRYRKIKVLRAPTGMHDIIFDPTWTKEDLLAMGFVEIEVGIAPMRTQAINRYLQAQRKQYALKHRVTSTMHAAMGDTLNKVAMQLTGAMFELWDKGQIIVAMTRTKLGKNVIFVGDKQETTEAIIRLVQTRTQWTDYMENILGLVTLNEINENRVASLTLSSFPFRICDVSLPHDNSGYVYFLISLKTLHYTYIGETKSIVTRLNQHNSGYGSKSTAPANKRPYAVMGYICGFDGNQNKHLRRHIEKAWKQKRDFLLSQGMLNPLDWLSAGATVIAELDDNLYRKNKEELRLIQLIR